MRVEVVLSETDITQEFADAMEARDIPEKFFYWFPRTALEWTALARDSSLYDGLNETWKTLAADAHAIAGHLGGRAPVISFGAGDGLRDGVLMSALKDAGLECLYFPVDASQTLLEIACANAEDNDIEPVGIKADISSPVHLVYAADATEPPRVFIISGNTLGAFDPLAEIRFIAQCMKPEDRLIVDGEIYNAALTISRRDNPSVRKFLSSMLANVGITKDDGDLRFDQKTDDRRHGLHMITRSFRAGRDLSARAGGQEISLERGERIGLNFQYTYEPEAFRWIIAQHGGLEVVREYTSPDERFLTLVCRK